MVRMQEMRQSCGSSGRRVEGIPEGPIMAKVPKVIKPPVGEVYVSIEAPKGELGYYIVSDGSNQPYRVRVRPPSFVNLQALDKMVRGALMADIVAVIGTLDIVLGEWTGNRMMRSFYEPFFWWICSRGCGSHSASSILRTSAPSSIPPSGPRSPSATAGAPRLNNNPETGETLCICCNLCALACPEKLIVVSSERNEQTRRKELTDFTYDTSRCMFCGLCEDACPVDALELTQDFELASIPARARSGTARCWKKGRSRPNTGVSGPS